MSPSPNSSVIPFSAARPTAQIIPFKKAPALRRRRKPSWRFPNHIRRREIERLARHVGAADTEDLDRFLVAWAWHNRQSNDPIWAIRNAARHMGRPDLTDAEASAIIEEASAIIEEASTRKTADGLAEFLHLNYDTRRHLRITTIGSVDVNRRDRKVIRRVRDKVKREQKRRAAGVRPRDEYLASSLSRSQPWKEARLCRRTWERHRNKGRVASVSAARLLSSEDGLASARTSEGAFGPKEGKRLIVLADGDHDAADRHVTAYSSLPLEPRLLALGLQSGGGQ
jgi:hypothetical protein